MRFINQNSSKTAFKVGIPLRSVLANAHTKSHYSTCKWTIVCCIALVGRFELLTSGIRWYQQRECGLVNRPSLCTMYMIALQNIPYHLLKDKRYARCSTDGSGSLEPPNTSIITANCWRRK